MWSYHLTVRTKINIVRDSDTGLIKVITSHTCLTMSNTATFPSGVCLLLT